MNCTWMINFDGRLFNVDNFMMQMSVTWKFENGLTKRPFNISACDESFEDQKLIFGPDSVSKDDGNVILYTQETRICVKFNSMGDYSSSGWSIYFSIMNLPVVVEVLNFNTSIPIQVFNQEINANDHYVISMQDGTLDVTFALTIPSIPVCLDFEIYLYNSSSLTDYTGAVVYNKQVSSSQFIVKNGNLSIYYPFNGHKLTYGLVQQVYRVVETHSKNCNGTNNIAYADFSPRSNRFSTTSSGECLFSIVSPIVTDNDNIPVLTLISALYKGVDTVKVVQGYDKNFTIMEIYPGTNVMYENINFSGNLISFIIPSNGTIEIEYHANFLPINYSTGFNITIFDVFMAPSLYQLTSIYNNTPYIVRKTFGCHECEALFNIAIKKAILTHGTIINFYNNSILAQTMDQYTSLTLNSSIFFGTSFTVELIIQNKSWFDLGHQDYTSDKLLLQISGVEYKQEPTKAPPKQLYWIIAPISVGVSIILSIIIAIMYYRYKRKQKRFTQFLDLLKEMQMTPEDLVTYKERKDELYIKDGKLFVNYDKVLGQGACSSVHYGYLTGPSPLHMKVKMIETQKFSDCDVAVKLAKNMNSNEHEQMYKEIQALKTIGYHENVMSLLGWSMSGESPCLVFETAKNDLRFYVRCFKETVKDEVPYRNFLSILWQITRGMQYISSKNLIHRDLAARNILLCHNNIAKISDLGLCCTCDDNFLYLASLSKRLPIKWLSIEALTAHIFSEKSDVWSFGVLMYEVYTFGSLPYATMTSEELLEFLRSGKRLECPENMSDELYKVMRNCWMDEPEERPNFEGLEQKFHEFLEKQTESYGYLLSDSILSE